MRVLGVLAMLALLLLVAALFFKAGYNAFAPALDLRPITHGQALGALVALAVGGWASRLAQVGGSQDA